MRAGTGVPGALPGGRLAPLAVVLASLVALALSLAGCGASVAGTTTGAQEKSGRFVLAIEDFLADIARNVAGDRLAVESLIPTGRDPHSFDPSPADVRRVADASLIIANGAGLEAYLGNLLSASGAQDRVVEASAGLKARTSEIGEEAGRPDPHFWLDPVRVKTYVENIRVAFSRLDPEGAEAYATNAAAYVKQLDDLDSWIRSEVEQLPGKSRLLVTNHETLGYFADRYGFRIVGALLPGVTTGVSPSARELAQLEDQIRALGVKAVILEIGTDPKLADQVAEDTGVKVVTNVYTHSLSGPDGPAPTYLAMMRHDVTVIVDALR